MKAWVPRSLFSSKGGKPHLVLMGRRQEGNGPISQVNKVRHRGCFFSETSPQSFGGQNHLGKKPSLGRSGKASDLRAGVWLTLCPGLESGQAVPSSAGVIHEA